MKTSKIWMALGLVAPVLISTATVAQEEGATGASDPYKSLAKALAISIAAVGGALGQGKIGAAALEGIARNPSAQPKIFVPMIIGLALVESLVIYALIVAFLM